MIPSILKTLYQNSLERKKLEKYIKTDGKFLKRKILIEKIDNKESHHFELMRLYKEILSIRY